MPHSAHQDAPCNIVIIGASGDLTKRKLIPALFSLYCSDMLPREFNIIGFARSPLSDDEFRERMTEYLTCRYESEENKCGERMQQFLARCYYCSGRYGSGDDFRKMKARISELAPADANTLIYMAIPPSIFVDTARSVGETYPDSNPRSRPWLRVVLEKPFGRDSRSSEELMQGMAEIFTEEQVYRIDHYLGKEVIQNLMILRFANLIFEPIWNREHIEHVSISWSEKIGCAGRAGYFDHYGIIRDVLQNHLLQIVALVGMEQPIRLEADKICDEKVKMLRCVPPITVEDTVVGQYTSVTRDGVTEAGYLDDPDVPDSSLTPTYVRTVLRTNNRRWYGVPFYLEAAKAINSQRTEIRIKFKNVPYSIYSEFDDIAANQLLIRVQPNEAIELHVTNKLPGLEQALAGAKLNLLYESAFNQVVPDAYERLLLDVLRGDRSLFIRADELAASWDIVTPLLDQLEEQQIKPIPYPFGSAGPESDQR